MRAAEVGVALLLGHDELEVAEHLGVPLRTAGCRRAHARAWLMRELSVSRGPPTLRITARPRAELDAICRQ